jgi:spermidine synthase
MTVSEIVPAVTAWARGPLAELYAGSLDDPRVTLHDGDVSGLIRAGEAAYDAILLDVDNGPQGLTRKENDRLYSIAGLYAARRALTPGGVLAVWSAAPSAAFVQRLRDAGFAVEEVGVRANGAKGARHLIWMARSPGIG